MTETQKEDTALETTAPRTKVLRNGAVYDLDKGRIVGRDNDAAIVDTRIKPENAIALSRKRQEKQARLLREAIVSETEDKLQVKGNGPAAAVAAAGGILWREVVLDENAYPRDRLDAWEKLGRHSGVLADPKQAQEAQRPASVLEQALAGMVRTMSDTYATRIDGQVVDADAVDNDSYRNQLDASAPHSPTDASVYDTDAQAQDAEDAAESGG